VALLVRNNKKYSKQYYDKTNICIFAENLMQLDMLSEMTKNYMRMRIEKDLYNVIFSASEGVGMEGIYYILQESPTILEEIIQKHYTTLEKNITKDFNYKTLMH
jgi:hypothetical protein